MKWHKSIHPMYPRIKSLIWKYIYNADNCSIISPSYATMNKWELLNSDWEVYRFNTLKEAKQYAENNKI